jgi:hypothetical protein
MITRNISGQQEVEVAVNMDNGTQTMQKLKWNEVVSKLLKEIGRSVESASEFSSVLNLPLPTEDIRLALPARFGRTIITPELAEVYTANLGFANQVINFHIDMGYAGLSALAGDCEKIWLLAPPREDNVNMLADEEHTLLSLVENLDGLVVMRQTAAEVMFLPPGVIHATVTIKTGILYGCNFRTRENIFGATMGLLHMMDEPDEEAAWEERDRVIRTWIDTLRVIAQHGDDRDVGEAVFSIRVKMMKRLRRSGAFRHWAAEIERLVKECYPQARLREKQPKEQ